jgi:hypothetical protein
VVTVASQTTNDTTPLVTGTVSDGTLQVALNGKTYTAGDGNLTVTGTNWTLQIPAGDALPAGTYNVAASATDAAGNVGTDGTTNELVIDTTAPVVTVGVTFYDLEPGNDALESVRHPGLDVRGIVDSATPRSGSQMAAIWNNGKLDWDIFGFRAEVKGELRFQVLHLGGDPDGDGTADNDVTVTVLDKNGQSIRGPVTLGSEGQSTHFAPVTIDSGSLDDAFQVRVQGAAPGDDAYYQLRVWNVDSGDDLGTNNNVRQTATDLGPLTTAGIVTDEYTVTRPDRDYFRFTAGVAGPVQVRAVMPVDTGAAALPAPTNLGVRVRDLSGRVVAGSNGTQTSVDLAEFVATGSQTYYIEVYSGCLGQVNAYHLELDMPSSAVSGVVFRDGNTDGFQDEGEPGLGGWTVYLDKGGDGQTADDISTVTATDGSYTLALQGLAPGAYHIREVPHDGWYQTYPTQNDNAGDYVIALSGLTLLDGLDFGNHDVGVTVSVSAVGSVAEDGASELAYAFARTGPATDDLTVYIAVGGSALFEQDYEQHGATSFSPTAVTVVIPAGQTLATVTVAPTADTMVEPDETVILTVLPAPSYEVGVARMSTGTIRNDDSATLTIENVSVTEGQDMVFTVTLSAAVQDGVTVDFATADGTATIPDSDYTAADGTLTFVGMAGEQQTITVSTTADTNVEPDETLTVALSDVSAANVSVMGSPAMGTITNDDEPDIFGTKYWDVNGDGNVAENVKLLGWAIELYRDVNGNGSFEPTDPYAVRRAITGVTQANPGVATSPAHGLVTGDKIRISAVSGMVELNGQTFMVTKLTNDTFSLGANTSGYGAYSGGGTWTLLAGDELPVKTTTTDAFGRYYFAGLTPGQRYFIREASQSGWGLTYMSPSTINNYHTVNYTGPVGTGFDFGNTSCLTQYQADGNGDATVTVLRKGILTIEAPHAFTIARTPTASAFSYFNGTLLVSGTSATSRPSEFNASRQRVDVYVDATTVPVGVQFKVAGLTAGDVLRFLNAVNVDVGGTLALQIEGSMCGELIAVVDDAASAGDSDAKRIMVGRVEGTIDGGVDLGFEGIQYKATIVNAVFGNPTISRVEVNGNAGNDVLRIGDGSTAAGQLLGAITQQATLDGGDGDDAILAGRGKATVYAGNGIDFVVGGAADDVLIGGAGDDRLYGMGGADRADGGDGNDVIGGGAGDDPLLRGWNGNDRISGGAGRDRLVGDNGTDVYCTDGVDLLFSAFEVNGGTYAAGAEPVDLLFSESGGLIERFWKDLDPSRDTLDELIGSLLP